MVCEWRNGLWVEKWFVSGEMVCGWRNGLWVQKWLIRKCSAAFM